MDGFSLVKGVAEGIAMIDAGLKAVELWERFGPITAQGIQTLDLVYDPSDFQAVARTIASELDNEYQDLFSATQERVRKCIRSLKAAAGDDTHLPQEREKFGRAARKCICREIAIIEDLMPGELPKELKEIWKKHKCASAAAPQSAFVS